MTSILLIYPYFRSKHDRSSFRFPPLGLGYIASSLRNAGFDPKLLDCTFLERDEALGKAKEIDADVVGIYSMVTMLEDSLNFARALREQSDLLIAGGPLPSCSPELFLNDFDVVVIGEGEQTVSELLMAYENGFNIGSVSSVKGVAFKERVDTAKLTTELTTKLNTKFTAKLTPKREFIRDLDAIAFPARDLFPNKDYIDYWNRRFGHSTTTVMTSRGCPFNCEFCSNAVFGVSYRERSSGNILDEVEEALSLGYDRIHFADDVFTLNRKRMLQTCDEILSRGLEFNWECLGRVDSIDRPTAEAMKAAGCDRIFFGVESGVDSILRLMNKNINIKAAGDAVKAAKSAGLKTGAFFILGYPGETDDTVLETIRFATSLPLDYLSFTMPYPLPGTALHERIKDKITREWKEPDGFISDHSLTFEDGFSEAKLKFAISKGQIQFGIQKCLGPSGFLLRMPFEVVTDRIFRLLK